MKQGSPASLDPTHKARRCEVGGLTLYSSDQLSKRNIFQISKLILFSDARVSRRNILCRVRHAIYFAAVLLVRNPRSAFEIPAQRLSIPQQTVLPPKNILLWIDDVLLGIQ
jgi:hypothetical protein